MRLCAVCGSFYESDKELLLEELKKSFAEPGMPDRKKKKVRAAIVPHAGYFFSGKCAAYAYKEIADSDPKKIIIFGPNHYSHESGIADQDWQTPLGIVKTDKKLAEKIAKNTGLNIDNSVHMKEHSIEVQIPFLQYVLRDFKICAIALGSDINYKKLGEDLLEIVSDEFILISSDFTHYGFNYSYTPFVTEVDKNLENLNKNALAGVLDNDVERFLGHLKKTNNTICGRAAIITFLHMNKKLKLKAKLLDSYKSSDILPDKMNSVTYNAVVFEKS